MPDSYWNSVDSCFIGLRYDAGTIVDIKELVFRIFKF